MSRDNKVTSEIINTIDLKRRPAPHDELYGEWLIEDTHTVAGFLVITTEKAQGNLTDAIDSYTHHYTTSQLRFTFRGNNNTNP